MSGLLDKATKSTKVKAKEVSQEALLIDDNSAEGDEINKNILNIFGISKEDFSEGREEIRKEAKSTTKEIAVVPEDQQHIWKEKTVSLQDSLIEAKADLAAAQTDPGDAVESTREAYNQFQ